MCNALCPCGAASARLAAAVPNCLRASESFDAVSTRRTDCAAKPCAVANAGGPSSTMCVPIGSEALVPPIAQDIRGSKAYARALAKVGIITEAERDAIIDGLNEVRLATLPPASPQHFDAASSQQRKPSEAAAQTLARILTLPARRLSGGQRVAAEPIRHQGWR